MRTYMSTQSESQAARQSQTMAPAVSHHKAKVPTATVSQAMRDYRAQTAQLLRTGLDAPSSVNQALTQREEPVQREELDDEMPAPDMDAEDLEQGPLQAKAVDNGVLQRQDNEEPEEDSLQAEAWGDRPVLHQTMFNRATQRTEREPEHSDAAQQTTQCSANDATARKSEQERTTPAERGGGLPAQLRASIEALSGFSMDAVRVHYNSDKPAQLAAHAYTQGTDIHIAPGQEKHLSHEAWHVVQQMQGRVAPTMQMQGVNVNDDAGLEKEADMMGERCRYGTGIFVQQKKAISCKCDVQIMQKRPWVKYFIEGKEVFVDSTGRRTYSKEKGILSNRREDINIILEEIDHDTKIFVAAPSGITKKDMTPAQRESRIIPPPLFNQTNLDFVTAHDGTVGSIYFSDDGRGTNARRMRLVHDHGPQISDPRNITRYVVFKKGHNKDNRRVLLMQIVQRGPRITDGFIVYIEGLIVRNAETQDEINGQIDGITIPSCEPYLYEFVGNRPYHPSRGAPKQAPASLNNEAIQNIYTKIAASCGAAQMTRKSFKAILGSKAVGSMVEADNKRIMRLLRGFDGLEQNLS